MNTSATCRICSSVSPFWAKTRILGKHEVNYFRCSHCGFIQTEAPYWLNEAYQQTINPEDTGILARNIEFSRTTAIVISQVFHSQNSFVDYAGGYGIFVRLMRDIGFNFYWHDPFSQNLLAQGFEYRAENGKVVLLTAFECFEHFADPVGEVKKMLDISDDLMFSTILLPEPPPKPEKWWYYGRSHGQHISFYTVASLKILAEIFGLEYHQLSENMHLMTKRQINSGKLRGLMRPKAQDSLFAKSKKGVKSLTQDDHLKISEQRTLGKVV